MELMAFTDNSNDMESKPVKFLYLDGYSIAERQLEGLPIKISIGPDGNLLAEADWPKGTDAAYWSRRAVEFAAGHDCFSTTPDLNDDDGFIIDANQGDLT